MSEGKKGERRKIYLSVMVFTFLSGVRYAESDESLTKTPISCGQLDSFVSPGITFSHIHNLKFVTSNAKTHKVKEKPNKIISVSKRVVRVLEGSL